MKATIRKRQLDLSQAKLPRRGSGLFIAALSIGLAVANMFFFSQSVALGDKIVSLERRIEAVNDDNSRLEKKLYENQSLTTLERIATDLGYENNANTLYLALPEIARVNSTL